MTTFLKRYPVTAGFVLMFLCTWPIDLWAAASSHGWAVPDVPLVLKVLVGWGFVVASLVMTRIVSGRDGVRALLRRFLVWRVGALWFAIILLGPAIIDLTAIGLHVLVGGATPDFGQPFARQVVGPFLSLWIWLPIFFVIEFFANGEEIGWRGYALPRLQARYTALVASIIIGIVWACWHLPKFLTAGSAQDYPFVLFVADTVAKAILFTWIFNSTRGSLLTATLFHASLNTSIVFLPLLPAATGEVRPILIAIGLHCLVAAVVVVATGGRLGAPAAVGTVSDSGPGVVSGVSRHR